MISLLIYTTNFFITRGHEFVVRTFSKDREKNGLADANRLRWL